jgi:hypothetical protein
MSVLILMHSPLGHSNNPSSYHGTEDGIQVQESVAGM